MYFKDPFVVGPAQPLTTEQQEAVEFDNEWNALGRPTLDERIANRKQKLDRALARHFPTENENNG